MNPLGITTASPLPPLTSKDQTYIAINYVSVEELCLGRNISPDAVFHAMLNKRLPLPSYVLGDQLMVPVDYFALYDDAGSFDDMRATFVRRLISAQRNACAIVDFDLEDVWQDYLSGEFGICLCEVTPESVVAKGVAMANITRLLAGPTPDASAWREELRIWVKRLDLIERPFADADEVRFGVRTSRAKFVDDVREAYPGIFAKRP